MNFLYYQKALALEMLGRNDQVPDNLMLYIRMAEPGEPFYADAASRIKSIGK